MLKSLSLTEVSKELKGRSALFICAPNYEARSICSITSWIDKLLEAYHAEHHSSLLFRTIQIKLQTTSNSVSPLEELRQAYSAVAFDQLLRLCARRPLSKDIPYPDDPGASKLKLESLESELLELQDDSKQPVTLLLDVSALPKRIIYDLFECIHSWREKKLIASKVIILYTWADTYPPLRYPSQVGQFRLLGSDAPLYDWLENLRKINAVPSKAVVFMGRQGFDSRMLLDMVATFDSIDVVAFMNRNSIIHSLETYRANALILETPFAKWQFHHVVSIEQGCRLLNRLLVDNPPKVAVIAPFSAKPFALAALDCAKNLEARGSKVGVVALSAHHYGSVYSLGSRNTESFEFSI
jgi:hypothetical protein